MLSLGCNTEVKLYQAKALKEKLLSWEVIGEGEARFCQILNTCAWRCLRTRALLEHVVHFLVRGQGRDFSSGYLFKSICLCEDQDTIWRYMQGKVPEIVSEFKCDNMFLDDQSILRVDLLTNSSLQDIAVLVSLLRI